ncbi:Fic/DOC family protein [Occultella kanbiaonis]|uniref:Fic/DOC family protein n=1 Tax=Occultella kanbiaonis TaxID=2675754 RepID=UPI001F470BB4|nr:Fic family protein [Occultella kanbiaonis]
MLRTIEYGATFRRQRELELGTVPIARTYDADHLKVIHRHLFQDVYEWAGEFRTVDMTKGFAGRAFALVERSAGEVARYLVDVHRLVAGTDWGRLNRDEVGERAAEVFSYLNQAHPFREGNGRASKVFMEHVAQQSRFTFDYSRVTPLEWNNASEMSRPDLNKYEPVPASLVPVFRTLAQPRSSGQAPSTVPTAGRAASRASYPHAATQATTPPQGPQQPGRRGLRGSGRGPGTGRGR